jgi:hypothetical protein
MDKVPASRCQDYEDEWFKVTHALADSEHDLADAMLDYLMHIIWQRLF